MSETEMWIRHGQDKVIALLHGIGAKDSQDYWRPFLNVLLNDEKLQQFGLFAWKYPTHLEPSIWRNLLDSVKGTTLRESAPRIKLLGGVWNTTFQTQFSKYKEVFLICHSMGGLVVKSWIIDVLGKGQSESLDALRHIAFYATPHNGAPISTIISWNKQLKDMQLDSPLIEDVGRRWHDHVVVWKEKALNPSTRLYNRYIPHLVLAGLNDNVVPYKFATIRGMDPTLVPGDHSQVIQPEGASDTRYRAWRDDVEKTLLDLQPSIPSSQVAQHQPNKHALTNAPVPPIEKQNPSVIDLSIEAALKIGANKHPISLADLHNAYLQANPSITKGTTRNSFDAMIMYHTINMPSRFFYRNDKRRLAQWLSRPLFKRVVRGRYMLLSPSEVALFRQRVDENDSRIYQDEYDVDDLKQPQENKDKKSEIGSHNEKNVILKLDKSRTYRNIDIRKFREAMARYYSLDEYYLLAVDLGLDTTNRKTPMDGANPRAVAQGFIDACEDEGVLDELISQVLEDHPNLANELEN